MNSIELFKKNAPELLDKIYKAESTTSDFDINGALVQAGKNANEIIKMVPNDKMLIETDSPYLSPEPLRGRRNDPRNVKYMAKKVA